MIKLTRANHDKDPVYVNPERINYIYRHKEHFAGEKPVECTYLVMGANSWLSVNELPEEVVELCQKSS